jgi:predicted O-methyltransferase YrrM
MNGQTGRRAIVRGLARSIDFDRVIETGTFRGTTTEFLAAVFGTPIVTIESDRRAHSYSSDRLQTMPDVDVRLGDSRAILQELADKANPAETTFFYLDAHWNDDLPLGEELQLIDSAWQRAVVMIDDFRVEGDDGYEFDDYGDGKRLSSEIIPPLAGWEAFYPSLPSSEETGMRRGCCVLATGSLSPDVASLDLLRRATI